MTKKTVIEVVTQNTEDQLDKVGALRNVAVNDAWKRVRQKIQIKAWSEADVILGEVTNGLQKINMSKSMAPQLNKLKTAFKTPDLEVDETVEKPREAPRETPKETPRIIQKDVPKVIDKEAVRGPDKQETHEKPMSMQQANELNKIRDGISELEAFLRTALKNLDNVGATGSLQAPTNIPDVLKPCLNVAIGICDKCSQGKSVTERLKREIAEKDTRYSDLEKVVTEKDENIDRLKKSIEDLEKKNEDRKEAKMETFKDQMKLKSYEKNIEQKTKEVDRLNKETRELKDRLNTILESKSAEIAEKGSPYNPKKLAEMYTELFKKEWKDVLGIQKTSHKRGEKEAMVRLSGMLKDAYIHCKETADEQLERLMEEFVYPCDDSGVMKGSQKLTFDESAQKQLNNLRKQTCTVSCEFAKTTFISLLEDATESRQYTLQEISDCLPFIEKCVELFWFCVLQTPPLVMETEFEDYKDKAFDKNRYDPYSAEGDKVELVVWPALYNENDGSVMAKGVVIAK